MVVAKPKKSKSRVPAQKLLVPLKQKIIAFVSQKGGVGKTTTATHAREWYSQFGTVLLVDADAQRSSSRWLEAMDSNIPFEVMGDASTLLKQLPKLKQEYDYVIVDAPGSLEEVSRAILSRCDLVAIPCQPAQLDLDSNIKTLEMVEITQDIRSGMPKAVIFFNRAEEGTILLREAKAAVDQELGNNSIIRLDTVIHKRQCIMDVPGQQTTVFQVAVNLEERRKTRKGKRLLVKLSPEELAKQEYNSLFEEVVRVLNE